MDNVAGAKASNAGQPRRPRTICSRVVRAVVALTLLVATLAGIGALYQVIATANDMRKYPPPGRMVDVGGYHLHLNCAGEGSPTVVMDAGLGSSSLTWSWVQPELSKHTRVCTYDRAGLGWSDPGPAPRTSERIVEELRVALVKAGIGGPYILVGHSFGGFNMRLYAYRYPGEVAGLVLVDATHENQLARFPPAWIRLREERYESYSWRGRFSFIGLTRLKVGPNTSLPPEWQDVARALNARTPRYRTLCQEFEGFEQSAVQVRDAQRRLQIPSIVLTAGEEFRHPEMTEQDCDYYNKVWKEMQSDLSTRLPGSRHVLVNDSGHSIQLDQPEAVVSAVLEILKEVRGRGGSSREEHSESGATNQIQ